MIYVAIYALLGILLFIVRLNANNNSFEGAIQRQAQQGVFLTFWTRIVAYVIFITILVVLWPLTVVSILKGDAN